MIPKLLWFHPCTSFELWPYDVASMLTLRGTEVRTELVACPPAKSGYSGPKRHWSGVLNGHFWNFANFSVHRCDRRTTVLCQCRGNECTYVRVKCHIMQLIFVCIKFWGSHCIYSRNTAYTTYSRGLVIDSVWHSTFSQNPVSVLNTFHSYSKQQIYIALAF